MQITYRDSFVKTNGDWWHPSRYELYRPCFRCVRVFSFPNVSNLQLQVNKVNVRKMKYASDFKVVAVNLNLNIDFKLSEFR